MKEKKTYCRPKCVVLNIEMSEILSMSIHDEEVPGHGIIGAKHGDFADDDVMGEDIEP